MHPLSRRHLHVPLVLALLFGLLLTLPTAHARAGTNRVVATPTDGPVVQTVCTSAINFCSLREALAASEEGDTILFNPQVRGTITLDPTQGSLSVTEAVTIQGPGAAALTIDGGDASRVLTITGGTVAISGVTITHGRASDYGGGIAQQGGNLTLTNCAVTNNAVSGMNGTGGGGIDAHGNLTLVNTTVSGNTVTDPGSTATVNAYGGGINHGGGTLTVTGSTIAGNLAQNLAPSANETVGGGGITEAATLHMTGSTVSGNRLIDSAFNDYGGGIFVLGTAVVADSTIADNSVDNQGGGIYNQGALTLTASTLAGNRAYDGGGVLNVGSATLIETLVARNQANDLARAFAGGSNSNFVGDGSSATGIANGSQGNLVGTHGAPLDPRLDPAGLRANGSTGPQTIALLPNSPAIDAGGICPPGGTTDERGQPRAGNCDIGAYEYQPVTPTVAGAAASVGGGPVTFQGTGFQTGSQLTVGATTVTATATDVNADGTQLRLSVPAHAAGAVGFTVTNPGGQHATGTLTYTAPTPLPAPAPTATVIGSPVAPPGPRPAKAAPASGSPNPLPTGR
jgi:hypothetical protein